MKYVVTIQINETYEVESDNIPHAEVAALESMWSNNDLRIRAELDPDQDDGGDDNGNA